MQHDAQQPDADAQGLLGRFFHTWRFPVFLFAALAFYGAVTAAILAIPPGDGALGGFARDFRRWCLDSDTDGSAVNAGFVIPFVTVPVVLVLATVAIYWGQFRGVRGNWRGVMRFAALGVAADLLLASGLALYDPLPSPETGDFGDRPFPAEKLRTAMTCPQFRLVDQRGKPVSPQDFSGKVVVLTGIYARCGFT
ncbi:MAG: hypothetical protein IT463_10465 [Planctomycetes bacterium]|nr:hypothetical protein [Planctomycetota bacterium]